MKPKTVKCRQKGCRRKLDPRRNRSPFCPRCASRRFKEKHPLKYAYNHLRKRARERGKEWALTYAEYERFAITTDYARLKGKTSLSLSIDRIDNSKGYMLSNIQAITLRENSRKMFVPRMREYIQRTMAEVGVPTH